MPKLIVRAKGAMRFADKFPRPKVDLTVACELPDARTSTVTDHLASKGWIVGAVEIEFNNLGPLITKGKPNVSTA